MVGIPAVLSVACTLFCDGGGGGFMLVGTEDDPTLPALALAFEASGCASKLEVEADGITCCWDPRNKSVPVVAISRSKRTDG